jgi:hypothetical protein
MGLRLLVIGSAICLNTACAIAGAIDCAALEKQAEQADALVAASDAGRVTTGPGNVFLYSAPDEACRIPKSFIPPGVPLNASSVYGQFTSVLYINFETDDQVTGWVLSARLKETGVGVGPSQKSK